MITDLVRCMYGTENWKCNDLLKDSDECGTAAGIQPCMFDSFEQALCEFIRIYISTQGFEAYQRLPKTRSELSRMMVEAGYLYIGYENEAG